MKQGTRTADFEKAKRSKKDEFYTTLKDIQAELKHYTRHFTGKVVYLNCDDPRYSNFFRYFVEEFHRLGLKAVSKALSKDYLAKLSLGAFGLNIRARCRTPSQNFQARRSFAS